MSKASSESGPPSPPVQLTVEAREYIRQAGGAFMLRSTLRHGCCGGRVEPVKAEVGRPRSDAGFRTLPLGDVVHRLLGSTAEHLSEQAGCSALTDVRFAPHTWRTR